MENNENTSVKTQADLELLFSKHQLLDVLVEQFSEISDDEFTQAALAQIYLHKQADVPTMVGVLSPKWGEPQEVADMLIQLCEDDLMTYDVEAMRFIMEYEISLDVQEMLERYQYPLPSITKPIPIGENKGSQTNTGYQTIKASPILNGSNVFNGMDLCLEHLDRANSVALELNLGVMTSEQGKPMPVVRKKDEDFTDFKKRKRQHDIFYSATADVMDTLLALSDEVYLTHKFDRRGRTYSCGYHVNTQGTDYNKAVLGLKNKELVT